MTVSPVADQLLVFARWPEAGRAKTRLIPALGAEGAAQLQRQMTQHTLAQVRFLQTLRSVLVTIVFAGGSAPQMQQWLGELWDYQPQCEGDLGDRVAFAIQAAFARGAERVVTIGTDCPQLDAALLDQAFLHLQTHDLVLGPATDGGYYLIGLRRFRPELFVGIDWSTERVFAQTVAIAQSLSCTIATLPPLSDIDRPTDLPLWERLCQQKLSVIIPVLNEATTIAKRLSELRHHPTVEAIVVDGGSQDDTVEVSRRLGAIVVDSPPGRAQQMNRGAAIAQGHTLLFLHADTQLPENFVTLVHHTLEQPGVVAGAFELQIDSTLPAVRWVEAGVKWRSHLLHLPYGDQAIFLRAATFRQVGGFPELPIMEDFALVQRLRTLGRVAIAPAAVLTSGRRWEKLGVWRTTLINQAIILGYFLGIPPEQLARWYRAPRF